SPFDPSRRPEFLRARAHLHFGEVGRSQQRDVSPTRRLSRLRRHPKKNAPKGVHLVASGGPEGNRTPDLFHAKEARSRCATAPKDTPRAPERRPTPRFYQMILGRTSLEHRHRAPAGHSWSSARAPWYEEEPAGRVGAPPVAPPAAI